MNATQPTQIEMHGKTWNLLSGPYEQSERKALAKAIEQLEAGGIEWRIDGEPDQLILWRVDTGWRDVPEQEDL